MNSAFSEDFPHPHWPGSNESSRKWYMYYKNSTAAGKKKTKTKKSKPPSHMGWYRHQPVSIYYV